MLASLGCMLRWLVTCTPVSWHRVLQMQKRALFGRMLSYFNQICRWTVPEYLYIFPCFWVVHQSKFGTCCNSYGRHSKTHPLPTNLCTHCLLWQQLMLSSMFFTGKIGSTLIAMVFGKHALSRLQFQNHVPKTLLYLFFLEVHLMIWMNANVTQGGWLNTTDTEAANTNFG